MKKRLTAILAMLFALLFLCGSALPNGWFREDGTDEILRFDDMPYERPDASAFRAQAERVMQALQNGGGYRRVLAMLDELFALYFSADTMSAIADIQSCRDVTDAYWAGEYAACLSALTEIGDVLEDVYLACASSPYKDRLEREYFGPDFTAEYGEDAEEKMSEGYVRLLEQENELLVEYRDILSQPTVMVNGNEVPVSDILYDVWGNRDYNNLLNAYYKKYNPILGDVFIRLMQVRKAQARELGYDSYAEMMYDIGFDRDYSVEEGQAFIESVKSRLLPVYRQRMNQDRYADLMEGIILEEQLYGTLEIVADSLGGEVQKAYEFMRRNELSDLSMSDVKANMSYTTYLSDYEAPFLFVNPYGDRTDIITVTHEFGHYAEEYISNCAYRSMDVSEVFSQAMQFLSLRPMTAMLGGEGGSTLRLLNLYDILDTFLWETLYAEFELRAYQMENPSVEALNDLMWTLYKEYGLDGIYDRESVIDWVDITHLFEQPFYVISYPVSACCALEIYERDMQTGGAGLESYLRLAETEEIGIVAATAAAGLQNPVTDERVQAVANFLDSQLAA